MHPPKDKLANKIICASIPIGIGDILHIKAQLDAHRHKYDLIDIKPRMDFVEIYRDNGAGYYDFVKWAMDLLFSEKPYKVSYDNSITLGREYRELGPQGFWRIDGLVPQRPRLQNYLCYGHPLDINNYIVMTTKVRDFPKESYNKIKDEFWGIMKLITANRPMVVLGERVVEMNYEYRIHGANAVYSIYNDIINNVKNIVDLTIPQLGITAPTKEQFMQDCLIMSKADRIITIGVGGNFSMALSVGETTGYRLDNYAVGDYLYNGTRYGKTLITKSFSQFMNELNALR